MSPEMLQEKAFTRLLSVKRFINILEWLWADEAHLIEEWGREWRDSYLHIGKLRNRLPSRIVWGAWSATMAVGKARQDVLQSLGFQSGDFVESHQPINRPEILFLPRFLQHGLGGSAFPDFDWLIPLEAKSSGDIPGEVICWCDTIELGTRFMAYLDGLIPVDWADRRDIVMPFHSLISPGGRRRTLAWFAEGRTKILVGTNCGAVGMNLRARAVVLVSLATSFALLMQWIGRSGRYPDAQAQGICYAPDWVRLETPEEKATMTPLALEQRLERRSSLEEILVHETPPSEHLPTRPYYLPAHRETSLGSEQGCVRQDFGRVGIS